MSAGYNNKRTMVRAIIQHCKLKLINFDALHVPDLIWTLMFYAPKIWDVEVPLFFQNFMVSLYRI